jgi:Protein of unknown function (DUF732)
MWIGVDVCADFGNGATYPAEVAYVLGKGSDGPSPITVSEAELVVGAAAVDMCPKSHP